jgi:hypothetical protein
LVSDGGAKAKAAALRAWPLARIMMLIWSVLGVPGGDYQHDVYAIAL